MRVQTTAFATGLAVCILSLGFAPASIHAQTVIVTGAAPAPAVVAPAPRAPRAAAAQPAQALGAPNPCVMVLPNGQQTQCPVVVIQAGQPPAAPQAQPAPQPYAQPAQPYAQPAQPYAQPAQPYAQPAQPYAQPAQPYQSYAQPYQPYRRLRRHRLRYTAGMRIPPGGSIVERRHWGFAIPGLVLFATHYLAIVWAGAMREEAIDAANYVPVIGPLLTLNNADYRIERNVRIYGSLVQAIGLALFIGGMHKTAYVEWRAADGHRRSFAMAPGADQHGGSLTARLEF